MFALLVTHEIATYSVKDHRLGPGMPFLDSDTCADGGGGYLFLPGFSSLYDAIHGWMTGRMDENKLHDHDHDVLYYM
jgi:hypothetical protein